MKNNNSRDIKEYESNEIKTQAVPLTASDEPGYSNASTYNTIGYEVDPRTGSLQVTIAPPTLYGALGNSITPSIIYNPQAISSGNSFLGLPLGWLYSFSYISASQVFINGQSAYYIDDLYDSGLRYYNLKNIIFTRDTGTFPYDNSLKYCNTLQFSNGEIQYFDYYGRLIGTEDRWGNYVIFYYTRNADVYNSKLSRIIGFAKQAINFSYSKEGIEIDYPQGGKNNISLTYLVDKYNYLVGYINPVGQKFLIVNNGGLVRNDLISKITYPNGFSTTYEYTTISYSTYSQSQFYRADCISAARQIYTDISGQSQTRVITYSYDPNGDAHNYTGYPTYTMGRYADTLLQSNDDNYRYVTQVDDGVFVTEHQYNRLHLELVTKTYTKDEKPKLITQTTNTFMSESDGKYFPPYSELKLIPNYQTPIKVTSDIYNDAGEILSSSIESDFDDYGLQTEVRSYSSTTANSSPRLLNKVQIIYDHTHYGQVIQKDTYDYTETTVISRIANSLTADNKNIATSVDGFVITENGTDTFHSEKKITYRYNTSGKIIYQKLEWDDGTPHALPGTETSTSYMLSGPVLTITTTNAQGIANTTEVDSVTGWVIKQMDAFHQSFNYTYDNVGRKLTSTDPLGVITTWVFEDKINKATTQYANGYKTYTYGNGFNDTIKTADNVGINQAERTLTAQAYNNKGQLIWSESILAANSRIAYTYDSRNQLSTATDALGNVTRYEYDSVAQTKTDFFNEIKVSTLNKNNNELNEIIHSSRQPAQDVSATSFSNSHSNIIKSVVGNPSSDSEWLSTVFRYDVNNQLSSYSTVGSDNITSHQDISRDLFTNPTLTQVQLHVPGATASTASSDTYCYNNLNRLSTATNTLGQKYIYNYNEIGQVTSYTDYSGVVFTCNYYANNQLASVEWADGNAQCKRQYIYYPLTQKIQQIEEFYQGASKGSISYTYTLSGAIESLTYPDGKTIAYEYDSSTGLLSQLTDAIGKTTEYTYDSYGRLIRQQLAGSSDTVETSYYSKAENAANSGKIKSLLVSNGILSEFTYDGFGLLAQAIITDNLHHEGNRVLLQTQYSYDPVSRNLISLQSTSGAFQHDANLNYVADYSFNSLNQLTAEHKKILGGDATTTNYQYDAAGNLTREDYISGETVQSTIYTYDMDNKLLRIDSSAGIRSFSYDTNGNLIDDGLGGTFHYDTQNRLRAYRDTKNNIDAEYDYYPNGLRASKRVNGFDEIKFYYDYSQYSNILNEIQGNKTSHYLAHGSKRYIRVVSTPESAIPEYFIASFRDIVAVLTDSDELGASYSYTPYGLEEGSSRLSADITVNPFRYTAEYVDPESSLIYLRARYYYPDIKRFVSRDTAQLINRYSYANGNPVMGSDPSGNMGIGWVIGATIAGIVVGVATGGLGALALGTGIGASIAVGTVAGLAGTAASNGITEWGRHESGEAGLSAKDWGVSLLAGAIAGAVGAGIGGIAGRAAMNPAMNAGWSAARVTAAGVLTASASGGFSGSVASAGITAAFNHENFFSADIWENIGISTAVGMGAGIMASGAHFGGGRLGTIPVEAEIAEISVLRGKSATATILEFNPSEASQWQNKTPPDLVTMTGGNDTVIVHGLPRFSFPEDVLGRPRYASAQTTARVIQNKIGVGTGPIRLISCYAGKEVGVENMAQTIANTLRRPVQAYTMAISINEVIGRQVTPITFYPT